MTSWATSFTKTCETGNNKFQTVTIQIKHLSIMLERNLQGSFQCSWSCSGLSHVVHLRFTGDCPNVVIRPFPTHAFPMVKQSPLGMGKIHYQM